jgi:hypothetical protein
MSRRKPPAKPDTPKEATPVIACPICHAPINLLTHAVDDALSAGGRAWRCPNGHRIRVEIQETFDPES